MSRVIRNAQESPNIDALAYPFRFLYDWCNYDCACKKVCYFDVHTITVHTITPNQLPGEPKEGAIQFPGAVSRYLWIYEGANEEEPWRALFEFIENNEIRYGYYRAGCDYTGFDCQGTMEWFVSSDLQTLLDKALTNYDYELYCKYT